MRYLVLSDVHANLEALEAVLADAPAYEAVLSLGDLVGYGPNPNECVERVRSLPNLTSLVGNHDLAALGELDLAAFNAYASSSAEWTARRLDSEVRSYLGSLAPSLGCDGAFLAHASPRDPVWEYLETPDQGPANFHRFESALGFVGHTHVPRVFQETSSDEPSHVVMPGKDDEIDLGDGVRRIVNPGGVGQPRNGDPRAAYGIWDTEARTFAFRRVPYSFEITQTKIRSAGLPHVLAERLAHGL
ncbi:MAG: metallophosphoesterase family protein [Chloroflexota bacterium]